MQALVLLVVLGLVLVAVWTYLARNQGPKAKLGPDGTNVREPETFVVHHEGKGQGLDIANTALKERTEELSRDLPGDTHQIHTPIPGRDMIRLSSPPSDVSRYGDLKVAPGATPGEPGAETKEKVLTEGPVGSRPGTPEEPGSPYGKGRRVTDNHRDVELAADLLPSMEPGHRRAETPPRTGHGRVILFRGRLGNRPEAQEISFEPDATWETEMGEELGWEGLNDIPQLPAHYGEDVTMVLVRNPRSLYVYWERAGCGDENLRSLLGEDEYREAQPCLRVFDVTSGAFPGQTGGQVWTIDVHENDDHWFLNEGIEPGREYAVSYERRTRDGRYYLLSHSWPVRTPHDSPAPAAEWDVTTGMLYRLYVSQPGEQGHIHPGSKWR
ncbi:MAG TPA: DUF4912 domain-containing protein [Symbiobacteriaceae bacterium]|nr:DUF4912 domain-containing protein [Symbiobacteriaceae bacterium]